MFSILDVLVSFIIVFYVLVIIVILVQALRIWWFSKKGKAAKLYDLIPFQQTNPKSSIKILFIGDSTAVGTGSKDNRKTVAGYFGEEFPQAHIVNLGKNGQKLAGLIKDFQPLPYERYNLLVVQVGGNDILRFTPNDLIRKRIETTVDLAKRIADTVVILHSGDVGAAPVFIWPFNWIYTRRTFKTRAAYQKTAHTKGAIYIDLFRKIRDDYSGQGHDPFYCPDNLHPSENGYRRWYEEIRAEITNDWMKETI